MTVAADRRGARPAPRLMLNLPNYAAHEPGDWDHLLVRARAAEAAGVDSLWVAEHVVLGRDFAAYSDPKFGGRTDVPFAFGESGVFLDPLIVLASVAAVTRRIRLMTTVLLAALRRPALLAKTCATLDVLSKGRLDLGVGIGWQEAEYDACGVDFARRGQVLDGVLEVCTALWSHDTTAIEAPSLGLDCAEVSCLPRPVQRGGVPIYISGNVHRRSVERLLRFGSGWVLWGESQVDPAPAIDAVKAAWTDAGRALEELRIFGNLQAVPGPPEPCDLARTMGAVPTLVDAGVTDFRFSLDLPGKEAHATEVLFDVMDAFRTAVA